MKLSTSSLKAEEKKKTFHTRLANKVSWDAMEAIA